MFDSANPFSFIGDRWIYCFGEGDLPGWCWKVGSAWRIALIQSPVIVKLWCESREGESGRKWHIGGKNLILAPVSHELSLSSSLTHLHTSPFTHTHAHTRAHHNWTVIEHFLSTYLSKEVQSKDSKIVWVWLCVCVGVCVCVCVCARARSCACAVWFLSQRLTQSCF